MPTQYDTYFEDATGATVRAAEHPEALARLLSPADDSIAEAGGLSTASGQRGSGAAAGDEATKLMAKGLASGARLMSEEEEAAEEALRSNPKAKPVGTRRDLGDMPGVARDATVPAVETKTCASVTCIAQVRGKGSASWLSGWGPHLQLEVPLRGHLTSCGSL
jgi:hypothetical protein